MKGSWTLHITPEYRQKFGFGKKPNIEISEDELNVYSTALNMKTFRKEICNIKNFSSSDGWHCFVNGDARIFFRGSKHIKFHYFSSDIKFNCSDIYREESNYCGEAKGTKIRGK